MDSVKKPKELVIASNEPPFPNEEKAAIGKEKEEYIGHLAAIVEFSDDAILSKSLDGIIKSWNKGSEKMFGFTAEEAIGKHISLIVPKEYAKEEKRILEKIINNEVIDHYQTVRNKKNGEQLYVSLTISPLKDQAGNIIGVSKIVRDVSSHKKAEIALIHANERLVFQNEEKEKKAAGLIIANKKLAFENEKKERRARELIIANRDLKISEEQFKEVNKELESFSYSVSHDLRAPLRAVNGYARMFKEKYETQLDDEADRLMNNITNNAKKMGQLIDGLLSFSRKGRKELVRMNIDMQNMVRVVCDELKNEAGGRNIEFYIKQLLPAKVDIIAIKQVWLNLVSNAIKYSKQKDISIIEIGSERKAGEIIYYIKDNGVGFDMRYANKLFGVFQRLHSEEEFEGTGIGLALVQRIILKHGGRVWAEAKINEGATFFFTLNRSIAL